MAKTIGDNIPEGFYREVETKNGKTYWAGPYASRLHAFDNAYANNELSENDSVRQTQYMINRNGEYRMIMHSKYLMEDIVSLRCEGLPVMIRLIDVPKPIYSNLIGDDGLLCF